MKKLFQSLAACLLIVPGAAAQAVGPGPGGGQVSYALARADGPVRVDARLDDAAWQTATEIGLGWEFVPGDNTPARAATRCRMMHDADNLYVGCEASDPDPASIRAVLSGRDNLDGQDLIAISLDPFGAARSSYEFMVTALGVQGDGIFDQQANKLDWSWDAIWESAGRIEESGYVVEMAIPFRSLRFPPGGAGSWRFHVRRSWPRERAYWMRSARIPASTSCILCGNDRLTGIVDVDPGRNWELTPTMTARATQARAETGAFGDPAGDAEAGLDVRMSLSSSLTLNGTLNPDFSQVEADATQLEVNTKFALSYPERRPFFQEGSDLFSTGMSSVFTRSIADPVAGMKLTGRSGRTAGGLLVARDAITNLLLPASDGSRTASLPGGSTALIARVRRDVGSDVTLGGLVTSRSGDDYYSHLASVDLVLRPLPSLAIQTQAGMTRTAYPDGFEPAGERAGNAFTGGALRVNARWESRGWSASSTYLGRSPGYRADLGFEPQVDVSYYDLFGHANIWGAPDSWLTRLKLGGGLVRENDWSGSPLTHWEFLWIEFDGWKQLKSTNFLRQFRETYRGVEHPLRSIASTNSFNPSRSLGLQLKIIAGDGIDYVDNRRVTDVQLTPAVMLRPGRRLDLTLSGSWQRLTLPDGAAILDASISRVRVLYSLSPRLYVRGIAQLGRARRDASRYDVPVTPRSDNLFTQLLLSYRVNGGTALYVGYGDVWEEVLDDGQAGRRYGFEQMTRGLYVKVGYAWRP